MRAPIATYIVSIPIGFSSTLQLKEERCGCGPALWFQSLSGFRVRCNRAGCPLCPAAAWCFNPYRVFEYVATLLADIVFNDFGLFQSLSGFRVRCNINLGQRILDLTDVFQSLSGFRVRCNVDIVYHVCGSSAMFQSLSGFRVRCNSHIRYF